ncbi:hypothetical protein [Saccharopolyspora hordei]|uniref:Uncharacterized protein n=1 Tax=Saccharopolyspora hordei TaxID=1838 RepID=A0A853AQB9_9PSEU|nr:hypothetical protein [Saccharopolyspora hordei]NYI82801.1 hypothetical protein [Saccharopolyspora hordei]
MPNDHHTQVAELVVDHQRRCAAARRALAPRGALRAVTADLRPGPASEPVQRNGSGRSGDDGAEGEVSSGGSWTQHGPGRE